MSGDKEPMPAVAGGHAQHDLATATEDLPGEVDEGEAEALPFRADRLVGQCQESDPLGDVPGEASHLEPGAIAVDFGDWHAPSGETGAELGDDVLLIAAEIGLIDDLFGRAGKIGQDVSIAVVVEEVLLALVVLDELAMDDEAIGCELPLGWKGTSATSCSTRRSSL